jgi:hypothetical protein
MITFFSSSRNAMIASRLYWTTTEEIIGNTALLRVSSIPCMGKPQSRCSTWKTVPYFWRLDKSTLYINKDYVNSWTSVMKDYLSGKCQVPDQTLS